MSRRSLGVFPALLIVIALAPAVCGADTAAKPYQFFVAGNLGLAATPDQFNSYYSTGFGGEVGMEYRVNGAWSFVGLIDYIGFSPSSSTVTDWFTDPGEYPGATNIRVGEGGITAASLGLLSKGRLRSAGATLYPYVKGGFGVTSASASQVKVTYDTGFTTNNVAWMSVEGSSTNFSLMLALGLEKELSPGGSAIFAEAGIHMIMYQEVNPTFGAFRVGYKL